MIKKLYLFRSGSTDPYRNLAAEQLLLESAEPETLTLYLWQNRKTVVIGRNQNAWRECRVSALEGDGGHLARRLSGGGAVFHDLGNLNFTFLMRQEEHSLPIQLRVIERAVSRLGIGTEVSGRNDVLAAGRKFSGNAFYRHNGKAYHHGTLLVDTDMDAMCRYLQPSAEKLRAKGVASVRSRTVNLRELEASVTVEKLADSMEQSLCEVYGQTAERLSEAAVSEADLVTLREHYASWDWNFGNRFPFDVAWTERFDWGELRLEMKIEGGCIAQVRLWSDAMEWELSGAVEDALTGCRFAREDMKHRLETASVPRIEGLTEMLQKNLK